MSGTVQDSSFSSRMSSYRNRREEAVRLRVKISEDGRDVETVNEECGTSGAIGMLK